MLWSLADAMEAATSPWWHHRHARVTRLESEAGKVSGLMSLVKVNPHRVLRVGLRTLVVALDPMLRRPCPLLWASGPFLAALVVAGSYRGNSAWSSSRAARQTHWYAVELLLHIVVTRAGRHCDFAGSLPQADLGGARSCIRTQPAQDDDGLR